MNELSTLYGWLIKLAIIVILCAILWTVRIINCKYYKIAKSKIYKILEKFLIIPIVYIVLIIAVIVFVII